MLRPIRIRLVNDFYFDQLFTETKNAHFFKAGILKKYQDSLSFPCHAKFLFKATQLRAEFVEQLRLLVLLAKLNQSA
jgi:hypothetical protein